MTTTAATARYARWDGVGEPFRLVDAPLPARPGPGEVLVRVDLATVCGSDLHTTRGHRSSPVPGVLGHEQVGRVVAVGAPVGGTSASGGSEGRRSAAGEPGGGESAAGRPAVEEPGAGDPAGGPRHVDGTPVRVGDRIVWSVAASCGGCRRCRRGLPQKCTALRKYGHEPLDEAQPLTGGFASHCVLAPGTPTVVVPDAVPDLVAAPASCATATVAAVLDAAGTLGPGDRALVTGAGMLGVTAVAMAARAGAQVVVADPHAGRRERALQFGAAAAVGAAPVAGVFDVALELSGAPDGVRTCLDSLDVGGTAVLAGSVSPGPAVELDPERLVRGLHTVVGVHNYAPRHLAAAVEFLAVEHDRFPFAGLTGGPWALDELDAAFAAAGAPGAAPRQAVRP